MFDVGFFELVIIVLVSLLVLGPERMPHAIRHAGLWIGRFKRQYKRLREDLEREIGADDIRRQLYNEQIMQELNANKEEMENLKRQFDRIAEEKKP